MEFVLVKKYQINVMEISFLFMIKQMIDFIIIYRNLMVFLEVLKIIGIEIDNPNEPMKGKIWVPYINEKR